MDRESSEESLMNTESNEIVECSNASLIEESIDDEFGRPCSPLTENEFVSVGVRAPCSVGLMGFDSCSASVPSSSFEKHDDFIGISKEDELISEAPTVIMGDSVDITVTPSECVETLPSPTFAETAEELLGGGESEPVSQGDGQNSVLVEDIAGEDGVVLSERITLTKPEGDEQGSGALEEGEVVNIDEPVTEESAELVVRTEIQFDFKKLPVKYAGTCREFENDSELQWANFTKGCKWAPDGSCILTNSEDCYLRIFNLVPYNFEEGTMEQFQEMMPVLKMKEFNTIYDYCWYPLMNSMDPSTCCFASTSRLNPVHLWDAYTGKLRCSYRAYNHVDEVVSALSLAFDAFGTKLYCGFDKVIRVFDVGVPGRDCIERSLKEQPGIISCIAVNPSDSKIYAAGSYLRTIGIYTEPKGMRLFSLEGQIGGITHLIFSHDGFKLFSGGRKDPEIVCWDLRSPGRVLYTMVRQVSTNQRIYFDLDSSGTYLASGNSNGILSVWDISKPVFENEEDCSILKPLLEFKAHNDCINGLSFNPVNPIMATSSGQRIFLDIIDSEEEDGDLFTARNIYCDNSLMLWWAGK